MHNECTNYKAEQNRLNINDFEQILHSLGFYSRFRLVRQNKVAKP